MLVFIMLWFDVATLIFIDIDSMDLQDTAIRYADVCVFWLPRMFAALVAGWTIAMQLWQKLSCR